MARKTQLPRATRAPRVVKVPRAKLKWNLGSKSDAQRVELVRKVVRMMTGNENFPQPEPSLDDLNARAWELEQATLDFTVADDARNKALTRLDNARSNLDAALTDEGSYIELKAKGRPEVILSSGAEVRSENVKPPTTLPKPEAVELIEIGIGGDVKARWKPVEGAAAYTITYQITAPNESWNDQAWKPGGTSTGATCLLADLPSGSKVWVQVCAVAGKGVTSVCSDPIGRIVP